MRHPLLASSVLASLFFTGCIFVHATDSSHSAEAKAHAHAAGGARANATLEARSSAMLSGTASFREQQGGVLIEIEVHHAPPGWHAVHVHEKGDCSAPDASSAGGHFNPLAKNHGSPQAPEHHCGDLGNFWVDEQGEGRHVLLMSELTVADGPNSVRGRALIVHAGVDDLVTQPTGNAGGRIACGVIQ